MIDYNSTPYQLMKRIEELRHDFDRYVAAQALYTVLNEGTPATLTANVNDYDPGNYDVLRMSSDAARNISGLAGGKKGRLLRLFNVGTQNILLLHLSGLSVAANQIISPNAANITLGANDSCSLYYDSTTGKWRIGYTSV